ncbi:MBL fold metallo-hydrolase [Amycolatopsis australiensis]|uniref:Glyoxylase, beta-lactamase superfamily II n=1 Tax=Amycolatopsis australiensis TaxID=546364 RepID=A0A1K1SPZ1_9PSEU|nr:MBL fold metallo-hydrolase [Amycolatopsis australiensis]SFW86292.1 Glyoxylase, beta-lactamase superfamily II [Amycolatopsis australiensis]
MVSAAPRAEVRMGDTTVTYLPDGEARIVPAAAFPGTTPDQWSGFLDGDGRLTFSAGSFLIRTPATAVLVDLGLGAVDFEVPGVGRYRGGALLAGLAAEGLRPADIDVVVFTHLHWDHVGWTGTADGDLTFPAARYVAHAAEWAHWTSSDSPAGPDRAAVQQPLADRIEFVRDGEDLAPGIRVLATPGHTPGHLSVLVTAPGGTGQVLVLGDVLHSPAQVAHPERAFRSHHDPAAADRARGRLLAQAHGTDAVLAAGHFAPAVFGRIRDRTWLPLGGA